MDLKGRVRRLEREAAAKHPEYYGALSMQRAMIEQLEAHIRGVREEEITKNLRERAEKRRKSSKQMKLEFP